MCDLRGRTRKLVAEKADEFYVNGDSSWPNPQDSAQVINDKNKTLLDPSVMVDLKVKLILLRIR